MAKAKTTANELPGFKDATPEQVKEFLKKGGIDPHILTFKLNSDFFGPVFRRVTRKMVQDRSMPTMAVSAVAGDPVLYWNPKFVAALPAKRIQGTLRHEGFHLVLGHCGARSHNPPIAWNYACDWGINTMLEEDELPEGGLIPGKKFQPMPSNALELMMKSAKKHHAEAVKDAVKEGKRAPKLPDDAKLTTLFKKQIENHEKMSKFQKSLPPNLTAEAYFSKLLSDPEVGDQFKQDGKSMSLRELAEKIANGDIQMDADGNLTDADGNPITVVAGPGGKDEHDQWEDLTDEERELLNGEIASALREAVSRADSSNGWGTIPASMQKTLREMVSRTVAWEKVLARFCGLSRRAGRTSTRRRLNKKQPMYHPGVKRNYTASILVAIDQSGSVGDDDLIVAFAEIANLAKKTVFDTVHFDTQVDENSLTTWTKGKMPKTLRTRGGGTCFQAITDYVDKNKDKYDGVLIITDMEAPKPTKCRVRRGWMVIPSRADRDLYFTPDGHDFVMRMKKRSE